MKRPNPKNYDLKPYGYIADLTKYIDYLEDEILDLTHTLLEAGEWD